VGDQLALTLNLLLGRGGQERNHQDPDKNQQASLAELVERILVRVLSLMMIFFLEWRRILMRNLKVNFLLDAVASA